MAISLLAGTVTSAAKVGDVNTLIAALNTELEALGSRVTKLEKDLADANVKIGAMPGVVQTVAERVATLEQTRLSDHGHSEIDVRLDSLENMIQRVPAENLQSMAMESVLPRPTGLDSTKIEMVYDHVTLYYGDLVMHAQRIGADQWRLVATLNYIVVNPAVWTYDEVVEGTPEEVYAHAMKRMEELAKLKPQHDAVHERVREMSEGRQ